MEIQQVVDHLWLFFGSHINDFKLALEEYQADKAEAKDAFWEYLSTAYEDFAQLRTTARSPASSRKKRALTKLYRHIALQVHPDKLPHACNGKAHEGMMKVILNEATRLKEADKVDPE